MAAYLIGQIRVKDEQLWQQYVEGVRVSVEPFDAEIVFRGTLDSVLTGDNPYDLAVVIKFDDIDALNNWYRSDKYQAIIPIRDQAADVVICSYQEN